MNKHWLARLRETCRMKGFWAGTLGKGDRYVCFAIWSGTAAQTQWDRQPFCQNLSLRTMPTGTLILKRSTEWSSYYPGKGAVIRPPQHQFCPCLRANAYLWLLYFLCPFCPSPTETLLFWAGSQALCWPVATWLEGIVYRQPGLWAPIAAELWVEGLVSTWERKVINCSAKQSWGGVGPRLQGLQAYPG